MCPCFTNCEPYTNLLNIYLVLDLPHPSTRPSGSLLLAILRSITISLHSFDGPYSDCTLCKKEPPHIARYASLSSNPGLCRWLTSLVANELRWIEDDETKEVIWEEAGRRLSERCGRTAMGDITRSFRIPLSVGSKYKRGGYEKGSFGVNCSAGSEFGDEGSDENGDQKLEGQHYVTVTLHEPAITADNLGLKTWASSYLLARRLCILSPTLPIPSPALELGSGTGLVGIACAAVLEANTTLTDLPPIIPNLTRNVTHNHMRAQPLTNVGRMEVKVLDWADPPVPNGEPEKYPLVLAADPLYSPSHPELLVSIFSLWVRRCKGARVVVEFPLRQRYEDVREDFWKRMLANGFSLVEDGVDVGWDDWGGGVYGNQGGEVEQAEVRCWWGVYMWTENVLMDRLG